MAIKNTKQSNNGFTLVEVIMVIFLFAFISVMSTSLFFSVLKSTSKSEIEKEVRQNGQYALSYMESAIRNAKQINTCTLGMTSLSVLNQNGSTTTFECLDDPVDSVVKIASSSGSTKTGLTNSSVMVATGPTCATSTLRFSCSLQTVTVNFTLRQAKIGGRLEDNAQIPFQTTISLRNYDF